MEYALVENNQVVKVGLPTVGILKDGRTVSVYNNLDSVILMNEGWLPLEQDIPVYDEQTQELQFDTYVIQTDKVIQRYKVVDLPLPQPQSPSIEDRVSAMEDLLITLI